ncbi:MAG: hypothetical protein LJE69_12070 [Thiohalocapsa sp.]|jgi:hypothetical protein|uniref:hypothetical protein n=1 Tax=Thiohalocapsa sp. TaxID=2497641 RepID=UPI0025EE9AE8|nr:hypothetical protein [Thiohalocapsa sp.]MCG6941972.1 hypothetical protein [Thiohalocapsa sp.]
MALTLLTTPGVELADIKPLLGRVDYVHSTGPSPISETLAAGSTGNVDEQGAASPQDAKWLLLYCTPERALTKAMHLGAAPNDELANWKRAAEAQLDVFRNNRERSVLFRADSIVRNPDGFYDAVDSALGLRLSRQPPPPLPQDPSPDLLALLAAQTCAAEDVVALSGELEASAIPLFPHPAWIDALDSDKLFLDYQELRDALQTARAAQQQLAERDAELLACKQLCEENSEPGKQKLAELSGERDLLMLQLKQMQAEMEEYHKTSEKERLRCRRELDAVYRSTSWRVTVPLRAMVGLVRGMRSSTSRRA